MNLPMFRARLVAVVGGVINLFFSGAVLAQASAQIVPGVGGCKDAVIYNSSQHHLQLSVDYLYEGADGSHYQGTASCNYVAGGATGPGQSCQVGLWPGPVSCGKLYTAKVLATKWTDMTIIWGRERRAAEIEQSRERENTMALARMLDEKNRRESADRARRNEAAKRQREAELATKRAEQESAMTRYQRDPMGLTRGMHGTIPPPSVQAPSNGSNLTPYEQQVRAEQQERDRQENYNRQLAYDNAAREKYNREAMQRQQQAEAQARSAQAAAERQRQQIIAAQQAAENQARQEAERRESESRALNAMQSELIGSSTRQSEQSLSLRKAELKGAQHAYKAEEADLDSMLAIMEAEVRSGGRASKPSAQSLERKLSSE
ncbi:MAG: hypothetical protein V4688_00525 [Pseudomonadota bacterium]